MYICTLYIILRFKKQEEVLEGVLELHGKKWQFIYIYLPIVSFINKSTTQVYQCHVHCTMCIPQCKPHGFRHFSLERLKNMYPPSFYKPKVFTFLSLPCLPPFISIQKLTNLRKGQGGLTFFLINIVIQIQYHSIETNVCIHLFIHL